MKGLILKDLYNLKGFQKQYSFILLFMIGWVALFKNTSFVSIYIIVMSGTIMMSALSLDESVQFNRFALTMPVSVEKLILEKYLLFLMIISAGTVISLFFNWITGVLFQDMSYSMDWQTIPVSAIVFILGYAIVLPISFCYGVEKGRYVYIVAMILLAGGFVGWLRIGGESMLMNIEEILTERVAFFILFMVILCVLALTLSYFISLRLVRKKGW